MNSKNHISKLAVGLFALVLFASSCKKENGDEPLSLNNAKAVVSPVNTATITGNWGSGSVSYGTIKLPLAAGDTALFTNRDNSYITAPAGYTVKYLYTTISSTASIGTAQYALATTASAAGVGYNTGGGTPNGWYDYIPPGGITIIDYVYIFITNPLTLVTYVIKVVDVTPQQSGALDRAIIDVEYGVVN
ncbi:hypothetical protein [Pedobacter metabolipauper]|uniref:Lipocalin-like protein n=1 Tax=Pedobacter metabolipauper TaxID=425513 RepID=A0A4R6SSI8_9SPHI|nr:hypothetical protein [Pedobacter metabolipauper]TDQ06713.1 hypothetical protein ATK78_4372 [Pedobacter metabolipauper]